MSDSKKGAFTVIVATIITSFMIFITDSSIAKTPNEDSVNQEQQVSGAKINSVNGKVLEEINGSISAEKVATKPVTDALLPPPGPFMRAPLSDSKLSGQMKAMDPPSAPKAPVGLVIKNNMAPAKPDVTINAPMAKKPPIMSPASAPRQQNAAEPKLSVSQPDSPQAPVSTATMPKTSQHVLTKPTSPKLNQSVPVKSVGTPELSANTMKPPVAPDNFTQQPSSINNDRPIWMQQDTRVIQDSNMRQAQQAIQQQGAANRMQSNNSTNSGGWQQYRYVPMPVYPSYYQQQKQVPMSNPGYYNAPMQNSWVRPITPGQAPINEKLLEKQSSPLPMKKDSNQ